MTMQEVMEIADIHGILSLKKYTKKTDLVRTIQLAEGREGCFKKLMICMDKRCFWWNDCQCRI